MYNSSNMAIMKDIKGYEGEYKITTCGKVWSEKSKKFLKYDSDRSGYKRVTLTSGNAHNRYMVHRLVYSTFCGDIPQGLFINHKNEIKSDNRIENLELVTCQLNNTYGTRIERARKTYSNNLEAKSRKSIRLVEVKGSGNYFFHSYKKASKHFGDTYGAFKMKVQTARKRNTNRITIKGVEYIIKEA